MTVIIPSKDEEKKPHLYIALDTETTGLWQEEHGICQIGAWATGAKEDDFRGYFVSDANPFFPTFGGKPRVCKIDDGALAVNKFTRERILCGPHLAPVLHSFAAWINKWAKDFDIYIVGQNTPFDVAWLKRDFHRAGLSDQVFRRVLDNVTLGYVRFGERMGQAKLAQRLGIHAGDAHDALSDAYIASRIFHRLKGNG